MNGECIVDDYDTHTQRQAPILTFIHVGTRVHLDKRGIRKCYPGTRKNEKN